MMSENGDESFVMKRAGDGDMKDRTRFSAKQTAKGLWQFEVTVEVFDKDSVVKSNPVDVSDQKHVPLGKQALNIIKDAEARFRADGKNLVSD